MNVIVFTINDDYVYEFNNAHVEEGVMWGWTDEQQHGVPLCRINEILVIKP
jgi:hypothetical protein